MKKSDLKTGMLVQYRNGLIRMVINNYVVGYTAYTDIDGYNDDLTRPLDNLCIDKISKILHGSDTISSNWIEKTLNDNLLWTRTEKKYELDGVEYSETTLRSLIKKATGE